MQTAVKLKYSKYGAILGFLVPPAVFYFYYFISGMGWHDGWVLYLFIFSALWGVGGAILGFALGGIVDIIIALTQKKQ